MVQLIPVVLCRSNLVPNFPHWQIGVRAISYPAHGGSVPTRALCLALEQSLRFCAMAYHLGLGHVALLYLTGRLEDPIGSHDLFNS